MITFKRLGDTAYCGRLGNQLFEIAATIGLAAKHNDIAVFPEWSYAKYFKNPPIIMHLDHITNTYSEPHYHFSEIPHTGVGHLNLFGYFQCEKYFEHCRDLIRYHFTPLDSIIDKLKQKYSQLQGTTCSLHIRRGDYVNNNYYFNCDLSYYERGIKYISERNKIDNVLVFSDDQNWCKCNFPKEYLIVENNLDIEDMFLMSMCSHNIICNSSFSWWASWFNKNISKIIIAPNKWFGSIFPPGVSTDKDVYRSEMIKL
jgi:hypothetical protein